mgnify:FL=1
MSLSAREEFRQDLVEVAVEHPGLFAGWELKYIKNRFPFKEEDRGRCAFVWAQVVGHRKEMSEIVREEGTAQVRAEFAFRFAPYKEKMRKTVETAKDAFYWAKCFPEDSAAVIEEVGGGRWAVKWADEIGDEEKMKNRISTQYWELKYEDVVEDKKPSFVSR